jgi:hypothetical protein
MGVRDLFFNIKAADKTGAAFTNVRRNLLGIEGMAARTSDRLMGVGRGMMRFGAMAGIATAPLLYAFRDSLRLYDEQERAQAKVTQSIKSTGGAAGLTADQLFRTASALQSVTRFGDEEILNGVTAQLLTFTNIAGDQFLMAQERAMDLATVLDGDLRSASIMLGKALNDPVIGLTAMSRAGVTFSKDQADVIKALAKTGDMAGAQNLILAELEKQYGGQARAAALAGMGAMDQLRNSWGDLKETVGGVIASLLPPITDFFKTAVAGFRAMPESIQKTTVVLGLLTLVAGPAAVAIGALTFALGAISMPVVAVAAGITALGAAAAYFWPRADQMAESTDNVTLALGDEFAQSQLLGQALGINTSMSVDAARKKLTEARARYENVTAIIAEQRALALASDEYGNLSGQIADQNVLLNTLGFPATDAATARYAEAFEDAQEQLAGLLVERQRLLDSDEATAEQLKQTTENIAALEDALANAEDGVVTFGDGLIKPIVPGQKLGGSMRDLTKNLKETKGAFDGFGKETSGLLKDIFSDGKVTMDDFGDFVSAWGDRLLDRLLSQVFDPIGDAMDEMFSNLFQKSASGGSGGGLGGMFGGLASGIGGFFGNLLGMDTGGELAVSGRNGIDRNLAAFRVSADENIKVVKRGNPDSGRPVNVYIQTPNPAAFQASKGQISADIARAVGRGARFA